jgi:hypothetical protein
VDNEFDWALVYPELANGKAAGAKPKVKLPEAQYCLKNWTRC